MIDVRCLDVTNHLGIPEVRKIYQNSGEDNMAFDQWYAQWLSNNPNVLAAVSFILANLFQNKLVVVYVGSYSMDDMITESFIKYMVTVYGVKSLFIENPYADVNEEIDGVDQTRFDDFSEYGIEAAKVLIDTYKPAIGIECSDFEIDKFGLKDPEYESIF